MGVVEMARLAFVFGPTFVLALVVAASWGTSVAR